MTAPAPEAARRWRASQPAKDTPSPRPHGPCGRPATFTSRDHDHPLQPSSSGASGQARALLSRHPHPESWLLLRVICSVRVLSTYLPQPPGCSYSGPRMGCAGGVKTRDGDDPGFPGAQCHRRVIIRGRGRVRGRETGDAALLAVRMEGGAVSQGRSASRTWKTLENGGASTPLEPPEGRALPMPGFSSVQDSEIINLCS